MGDLLTLYESMQKTAEVEQEKNAHIETLQKYAELAETKLKENGAEYTEEDVVKVASFMIDHDIAYEDKMSKIAEFVEAGQIMARSFAAELQKTAEEKKE
jgi:hypothetical protein